MRKLILLCSVLGIGLTLSGPLAMAQPGPGRDGRSMAGPHGPGPGYNHRPPRHRHWRMRNHRRYYY